MKSDGHTTPEETLSDVEIPVASFQAAIGQPLHHYWRVLTTAGRAAEGLRSAWRDQARVVQEAVGFSYIRFHGLFHDEMMVCRTDGGGDRYYTWTYIDDLFDFLLSIGLRPFVELGFMPEALASGPETVFFWKGNITPPKDPSAWVDLVEHFVRHCIARYGADEIRQWYFEVWNEPNLGGLFWTGGLDGYLDLYRRTAIAIKEIDPKLRVGGPATSNFSRDTHVAPWFAEFSEFCSANRVPVDFFSCHPYPNSWALDTGGNQLTEYRERSALNDDLRWLREFTQRCCNRDAELHLTEWNSSPSPRDLVHDTAFMGPFLVDSYLSATGLVDSLGYWAFTDLFEENGLGSGPLHGGFGLMTVDGIPKPSFHAVRMLSRLGTTELGRGDGWIVTRREDRLQILLWNYCHYTREFAGGDRSALTVRNRYGVFDDRSPLEFTLSVDNLPVGEHVQVLEVNREVGSVFDAWVHIGAPEHLSRDAHAHLLAASQPRLRTVPVHDGRVRLAVPPHGLAFFELDVFRRQR